MPLPLTSPAIASVAATAFTFATPTFTHATPAAVTPTSLSAVAATAASVATPTLTVTTVAVSATTISVATTGPDELCAFACECAGTPALRPVLCGCSAPSRLELEHV